MNSAPRVPGNHVRVILTAPVNAFLKLQAQKLRNSYHNVLHRGIHHIITHITNSDVDEATLTKLAYWASGEELYPVHVKALGVL